LILKTVASFSNLLKPESGQESIKCMYKTL